MLNFGRIVTFYNDLAVFQSKSSYKDWCCVSFVRIVASSVGGSTGDVREYLSTCAVLHTSVCSVSAMEAQSPPNNARSIIHGAHKACTALGITRTLHFKHAGLMTEPVQRSLQPSFSMTTCPAPLALESFIQHNPPSRKSCLRHLSDTGFRLKQQLKLAISVCFLF